MKQNHVVYLARNPQTHQLYIGVKSFYKYSKFEEYNTSSSDEEFKSVKLHKIILSYWDTLLSS